MAETKSALELLQMPEVPASIGTIFLDPCFQVAEPQTPGEAAGLFLGTPQTEVTVPEPTIRDDILEVGRDMQDFFTTFVDNLTENFRIIEDRTLSKLGFTDYLPWFDSDGNELFRIGEDVDGTYDGIRFTQDGAIGDATDKYLRYRGDEVHLLRATTGSQIIFSRANTSEASPSAVNAGEGVGVLTFKGYDGAAYEQIAQIYAAPDGSTLVDNPINRPGKLVFFTTTAVGISTLALTLDRLQAATFAGAVTVSGALTASSVLSMSGGVTGASPTPQITMGSYFDNAGDASISHIDLYGGAYGFGIQSNVLVYVSQQYHKFYDANDLTNPVLLMQLGEMDFEGAVTMRYSAPYLTIRNYTAEDTAGGRESRIIFKGDQSGGETTTLGYFEFSHDGAADDQKGQWRTYMNDGNDGDTPTLRLTLDSAGAMTLVGAFSATTIGGITEANLVDKSAAETITGAWSFDGNDVSLKSSGKLRLYRADNGNYSYIDNTDAANDMGFYITGATADFRISAAGYGQFANGLYIGAVGTDPNEMLAVNGNVVLPKASGGGIKVDLTTPTFGWADILGEQFSKNTGGTKPTLTAYNGVVYGWLFAASDEAYLSFHIPHDYVPGTDIYLHVHWSHISTLVTGGTVTFKATSIYAKGHNQAAFGAPVAGTFTGNASTTQYQHIISETQYSASSPAGLQIDTDLLEPDGVIELTLEFDVNNITSSGAVPDIFIHYVDIHYQTTAVKGTKNKAPNFYS